MAQTIISEGFSHNTKKALNDNFTELYALGGGGGGATTGSGLVLTAPDATLWEVTISNAGALQTAEVTEAGDAQTSLTLIAADAGEWTVTVNNAGALVTTAV